MTSHPKPEIIIRVKDGKTAVHLGIAFGVCAGFIVGFMAFAFIQNEIYADMLKVGLFTRDGKIYSVTEVHK